MNSSGWLSVYLMKSAAFDLHQEERPIQCPVRFKRRRPRERQEVRLGQELVVNGFARGGAFSNCI
jgi:hypothetical protein